MSSTKEPYKHTGRGAVIRFRLRERISDREFELGRRITLSEIATETGINRTVLSKMSGPRGYNTTTDVLERLCRYFGCQVGDLVEYVPDDPEASEEDEGPS
nr:MULTISPECIES: helix-turn-helix transcriptional regulator [unclassified Halorhodospira]